MGFCTEIRGDIMLRLMVKVRVLYVVLALLVMSPHSSKASVDLLSETTFYKFDSAWVEISGDAENSVYDIATLYIRHIQITTQEQRLLHIPVSVRESLPLRMPLLGDTRSLRLENLDGKTLSEVFNSIHKKGLVISAGSISEDTQDELYVIYSDRSLVEVVNIQTILDLPL
jgi:hypothetical protein